MPMGGLLHVITNYLHTIIWYHCIFVVAMCHSTCLGNSPTACWAARQLPGVEEAAMRVVELIRTFDILELNKRLELEPWTILDYCFGLDSSDLY